MMSKKFLLKMWLRYYDLRKRIGTFLFTIDGTFSLALSSYYGDRSLWKYCLLKPIAWVYGKLASKFSGRRYKQEKRESEAATMFIATPYLTKWGRLREYLKNRRNAKDERMLNKCEEMGLIKRFSVPISMNPNPDIDVSSIFAHMFQSNNND